MAARNDSKIKIIDPQQSAKGGKNRRCTHRKTVCCRWSVTNNLLAIANFSEEFLILCRKKHGGACANHMQRAKLHYLHPEDFRLRIHFVQRGKSPTIYKSLMMRVRHLTGVHVPLVKSRHRQVRDHVNNRTDGEFGCFDPAFCILNLSGLKSTAVAGRDCDTVPPYYFWKTIQKVSQIWIKVIHPFRNPIT